MEISKLPLLLHALLETAASLSFTLNPTAQLPGADSETRLVLRNYGSLLFSSSILCFSFYFRPGFDSATATVAGSMAIYHIAPVARAYIRIAEGRRQQNKVLGGSVVHLFVHLVAFGGLAWSAVYGRDGL